jgi:ArsR family transcriptional regulator
MTYTKSNRFDHDLQQLAKLGRVLSHPARLSILRYLANCKTCISGDISSEIPLSRTTVSQHLQELKNLGLIKGEIEGVKVNYCLSNSEIAGMIKLFEDFFNQLKVDDNICGVDEKC